MRNQKNHCSQPGQVIRLIRKTCFLSYPALVCVGLLLIGVLGAQPVLALAGTSVAVDPAASQLQRSCTDLVKIMVNNVTGLYAMDLTIQFEPAIVQVMDMDALNAGVQIRQGSFLEKGYVILNKADNAAGTIRYAATQIRPQSAKSGSGVLLEIAFSAVALGVSPVTILNAQLVADGVIIPAAIANGSLEVTSFSPGDTCPATPTPTLEATQTFTATSTPTPSSTATMTRTNTVAPRTKTPTQAFLAASTPIPALLTSPTSANSVTPVAAFTPAQTVEPAQEQPAWPAETPLPAAAISPTQACGCAGTAAPAATPAARRGTLSLLLELFAQPQTYLICLPLFLLILIAILLFHLNLRKESEEEEPESEPEIKEMP